MNINKQASETFKQIVKALKSHGFTAERLAINHGVSVSGAPLFVYKDPKFLGTRFILPADRYIVGSPEYVARRRELGLE